jgi:transposase InsO family protein
MRCLALLLGFLLPGSALAHPAQTAMQALAKSVEGKAAPAAWPVLKKHVDLKRGLVFGEDWEGLDDESTAHKGLTVLTGAALEKQAQKLVSVLAQWDTLNGCKGELCSLAASHFETRVRVRMVDGAVRVLGIFDTNALVVEARAQEIEANASAWMAKIDAVHGADRPPLPPISLDTPTRRARKASDRANSKALVALHKGDRSAALAGFDRAVRADPGNLMARYNLACVWALGGQHAAALAELAALKKAGCPACVGRVVRAAKDKDWKALHTSPAFKALSAGTAPPSTTAETVAKALDAALAGRGGALEPLLHHRDQVILIHQHSISGDGDERVLSRPEFKAWVAEIVKPTAAGRPTFNGFEAMKCAGRCCTSQRSGILHNNLYLDEVCVRRDSGGAVSLSKVRITDGD